MNEGARHANEWTWRRSIESKLARIIALLERLTELSPKAADSPDGESEEGDG